MYTYSTYNAFRFSNSPVEKNAPSPMKPRDKNDRNKDHHESPDRHKRKKKEDEESDRERHKKDQSDDEKSKKSRDKKKKKEKKEAEKKKRKEKKERRERKEEKEKKSKEETKKAKTSEELDDKKLKEDVKPEVKPEPTIKPVEETKETKDRQELKETKVDLYGDILTEGIDTKVVESYGKIEETQKDNKPESPLLDVIKDISKDDADVNKELDDSEKDILELHTSEADLKTDIEKTEVLAPVPEKSKWEIDEDVPVTPTTPIDVSKQELKSEKHGGKVTNEVLKRAENAIFAKAINAIRPIEIKKISLDRAKLYSGDRERKNSGEEFNPHNIQVTITGKIEDSVRAPGAELAKCVEVPSEKPRLSVKERLGVKVEDLDRIVKVDRTMDRNRSCSLSPLSKRASEMGGGFPIMERRIEVEDKKKHDEKAKPSRESTRYSRCHR